MFFFKSKALTHKQTAMIGLVLSILSLLTIAVIVFLFPLFGAWLNNNGVYFLDLFLLAFFVTVLFAVKGLLLFGFPLYYAQDKKSHMTGFQIMIFTLLWMMSFVLVISLLAVPFSAQQSYTLQDLTPQVQE